ncbi:Sorbitol dehydrogenase [Phaffia rhodozyma]|uniref:Sorbitol dehydrogenase n=1 Tax=Phaffia rhodozyma TaxID=264483 RepID=A0A0F7SRA0_PHARH|nr:Sorbitol dehydrogenase [Phaffia rhodozyma]
MTTFTATVLHGARDLKLETRTLEAPTDGKAQIRIIATGLCGSDVHYYTHNANGAFKVQKPLVLGHEAGGVITSLPESYKGDLKVGDKVAIEAGVSCSRCGDCKGGRYNLCNEMSFCSSAKTFPHRDGTLQEYMIHDIDYLYKMPADLSFELASIAEPLSVILQATRRSASPQPGSSILILGCGAVGLLAAAVARSMGATRIAAVDIDEKKLEFAKEQGWVDEILVLPRGPRLSGKESLEAAKTLAGTMQETFGSAGFDAVFECSGVESCMQVAIFLARTGGKVVFIGMGTPEATLPTSNAFTREVDLIGVFRYSNTYPTALSLLASGRLGPGIEKMVTQRYPLEKAALAFEAVAKGRDENGNGVIKTMVGPDY